MTSRSSIDIQALNVGKVRSGFGNSIAQYEFTMTYLILNIYFLSAENDIDMKWKNEIWLWKDK